MQYFVQVIDFIEVFLMFNINTGHEVISLVHISIKVKTQQSYFLNDNKSIKFPVISFPGHRILWI